jgi:hypothetical protein
VKTRNRVPPLTEITLLPYPSANSSVPPVMFGAVCAERHQSVVRAAVRVGGCFVACDVRARSDGERDGAAEGIERGRVLADEHLEPRNVGRERVVARGVVGGVLQDELRGGRAAQSAKSDATVSVAARTNGCLGERECIILGTVITLSDETGNTSG